METRLRTAGRELRVEVRSASDGESVAVDGVTRRVIRLGPGPRTVSAGALIEELALEIDGRVCRALVARRRDEVLVALDGRVHRFETGEEVRAGGRSGGRGSGTVVATMPGKVIAVLVGAGDAVEAGQPVIVLEAMKMETTLAAEVTGCVTAVAAVAGTMVDAGAVLIEITPA